MAGSQKGGSLQRISPAPVAQAEAPPPVVELPPGAKVVIADTPPPPIPVPAPAPVVVEAVPPEPVVDPPKAEPVVVAAEEPVPPVTVAALPPAPVIVAPENPRPTFYYALGAGTLLLLLALRLFFRRRPAEGASLISKSLSQK